VSTPAQVEVWPGVESLRIVSYDRERHGDGPYRVVGEVWLEYGWEIHPEHDADVVRPDLHYGGERAAFMVAEGPGGEIVGCVGLSDEGEGVFHLHRLYVLARARRGGLGGRLVTWGIDEARRRGAAKLILFSDVAFEDAHRLYRRLGFRCTRFRYSPDAYESREWGFELPLA
jgi:GNAT superfamily N-acetyltransferase